MLCYRDKCYCMRSNKTMAKNYGLDYCDNKECYRHSSEIPSDKEDYIPICWSTFEDCDKQGV